MFLHPSQPARHENRPKESVVLVRYHFENGIPVGPGQVDGSLAQAQQSSQEESPLLHVLKHGVANNEVKLCLEMAVLDRTINRVYGQTMGFKASPKPFQPGRIDFKRTDMA